MKRICLVLLVVCFIATAAMADTVTSVNVVGYVKKAAPPGVSIMSTMLYQISGTNTLSEILGTNGVAGTKEHNADCVYIYNGLGYDHYFLYDESAGEAFDHKWVDGEHVATNIVLPGDGFWVRNRDTVTNVYDISGEVVNEGAITNTIVPGLQIIAYPYSCDVVIGDLTCTNGLAGTKEHSADCIYVYNDGSYDHYFLYDESAGEAFDHKWVDGEHVATNILKAGQGFWYRNRLGSSHEWVENRPYLNE